MAKVLIVDDEKSIRRTLGEFLREAGYTVAEAEDADVALKHLAETGFDVVVSDIILPRVTGVELLQRLQKACPTVQVVMMTGEPTVESATESLRAGAVDYLFKPINKAAILRVVANAARIKSLEDARRRLEAENQAHRENLERLVQERTAQLVASEENARHLSRFNQCILDALTANICVLGETGQILAVNAPWRAFATSNPPFPKNADVGANYLAVCETAEGADAALASEVAQGLRKVIEGHVPEYALEYPCHAPHTQRWFMLRATRFAENDTLRVVVAHMDITARILAQIKSDCFARLGQSLGWARTAKQAAQIMANAALDLLGWDACYLALVSLEADTVNLLVDLDAIQGQRTEVTPPAEGFRPTPMFRRVLAEGPQLLLRENPEESSDELVPTGDVSRRSRSLMFVPIRREGQCIGVFSVQSYKPRAYTAANLETLQALADHGAGALERLHMEAELARNHLQYRRAIIAANAIPYQKDYESDTYVFMGEGIKEITGYAPSELRAAVWKEMIQETVFLGEAAGVTATEAAEMVLAGELRNWRADHRIRTRTRETRWICDSSISLFGPDGHYKGSLGIIQDITERKQAEQALRESEERFRSLYENTLMGLYRTTPDGRILLANPTLVRMLGYDSFEELARQNLEMRGFPPDSPQLRFKEQLEREGSVQGLESAWIRADGSTIFVRESARAIRGETGQILYYDGVVEDVTERKQAETQLRKLARAVEQSPVSIIITDRSGNIEFVNPKFTEVSGYTAAEAMGRNPRFLKSGGTPSEDYRRLWETITAGQEWRGEFRNRRKDGTLFWESVSISPMHDSAEEITHFIAVKEDVTEKRKLEAQFLRTQRMESIGTLAGGVAHDLNNILAPIMMATSILRDEATSPGNVQMLELIQTNSQRAADIIKQLLTFARGVEGERILLQPKHLIREMLKIAGETFPKSIQLRNQVSRDLWPVRGDATQVHQVLLNLCVNARDAMREGGTLTIAAHNVVLDAPQATALPGLKPGPHVLIEVADTGHGIPPEVLERIFDPFFTTKPPGKGTGLGLSTVLGIAQSHGGYVSVATEVNRGTTFQVYFPAHPEGQTEAARPQSVAVPAGQGETILVVDDEASIRHATQRVLSNHGYQVLLATNGAEAVTIFTQHRERIGLVLTDLMMPVMDGLTLVRELRKIAPAVKVIASTGVTESHEQADRIAKMKELSVTTLLVKPYVPNQMLAEVHKLLHSGSIIKVMDP